MDPFGLKPGRFESFAMTRWRIGACEVSIPPSSPWSQLLSCTTLETWRCVGGACVHANSGGGRPQIRRSHVRPDDSARFRHRVRRRADLRLEAVGLVHLVHAPAVGIELPAVIDAAQAALFVAPEEQRGAAMRAEFVEETDAALRVAERDEVFAEELDADGRTVGLGQFPREQRGHPVSAHGVAHRRAGTDAGQELVVVA